MQLFGSLKLLMALLGSSCPLFGRSGPKVGPKMVPKSGPKSDQKVGQKWHQKWSESPQKAWSKKGSKIKKIALTANFFQRFGLLKMLTWRCLKDSLKTVPTWFQNGSRLPKVFKIAPKIRPYKDILRFYNALKSYEPYEVVHIYIYI